MVNSRPKSTDQTHLGAFQLVIIHDAEELHGLENFRFALRREEALDKLDAHLDLADKVEGF